VKRVLIALLLATVPAAPALAKKKKAPAAEGTAKKGKDADKPPPPGDKRTNEGAQGRMNATEDAARDADSPQFQHRP
jgi:hypothetical protein